MVAFFRRLVTSISPLLASSSSSPPSLSLLSATASHLVVDPPLGTTMRTMIQETMRRGVQGINDHRRDLHWSAWKRASREEAASLTSTSDLAASEVGGQEAIGRAASAQGSTPPPPWTATRLLTKRKTLAKRMGHMMRLLEQEKEEQARVAKDPPEFSPGDAMELKLTIPENKRRTSIFKGICIAKRNRGWRSSFTLRNHIGGGGAIERTFPLYSPHLLEIKVLRKARRKIRRAKLYYLREAQPKEYKV